MSNPERSEQPVSTKQPCCHDPRCPTSGPPYSSTEQGSQLTEADFDIPRNNKFEDWPFDVPLQNPFAEPTAQTVAGEPPCGVHDKFNAHCPSCKLVAEIDRDNIREKAESYRGLGR